MNLSRRYRCLCVSYPVLAPISRGYPRVGGRLLTCYSPVRHCSPGASTEITVRLACVKHAASVRPEPGSNSPLDVFWYPALAHGLTDNTKWPRRTVNLASIKCCRIRLAMSPSSAKARPSGLAHAFSAMTIGIDFWHAVEFSRSGRASIRVSRPFWRQPSYFICAGYPCQPACPRQRAIRITPHRDPAAARFPSPGTRRQTPGASSGVDKGWCPWDRPFERFARWSVPPCRAKVNTTRQTPCVQLGRGVAGNTAVRAAPPRQPGRAPRAAEPGRRPRGRLRYFGALARRLPGCACPASGPPSARAAAGRPLGRRRRPARARCSPRRRPQRWLAGPPRDRPPARRPPAGRRSRRPDPRHPPGAARQPRPPASRRRGPPALLARTAHGLPRSPHPSRHARAPGSSRQRPVPAAPPERPAAREAQRVLAADVTTLVHGHDATDKVIAASHALFGQGELADLDAATLAAAVAELPRADVSDPGVEIVDLLVAAGLVAGRGAGRRAIAEGGVSVNNVRVQDADAVLTDDQLLHGHWAVLRRGKRTLAVAERALRNT